MAWSKGGRRERRQRCAVCGRLFHRHPRKGLGQRTCGGRECQRERHRRACAEWHVREPGPDRDRRLRQRLLKNGVNRRPGADPRVEIDWDVAESAVGAMVRAVVEETAGVLVRWIEGSVVAAPPAAGT